MTPAELLLIEQYLAAAVQAEPVIVGAFEAAAAAIHAAFGSGDLPTEIDALITAAQASLATAQAAANGQDPQ